MLHKLGVSMGERLKPPNSANPKGFFEAVMLGTVCRALFKEPQMSPQTGEDHRIVQLARWFGMRRGGKIIGAKHPALCMMIPEMLSAWPGCKIVAVDRPAEESVESMRHLGNPWGWPLDTFANTTQLLISRRDADLKRLQPPLLRLTWKCVLADPTATMEKLITFCDISPTDSQKTDAVAHVTQ